MKNHSLTTYYETTNNCPYPEGRLIKCFPSTRNKKRTEIKQLNYCDSMRIYRIHSSITRFRGIRAPKDSLRAKLQRKQTRKSIGVFDADNRTFYVVSRTINLVQLIFFVYTARPVSGSPYARVFNLFFMLFDSVALCSRFGYWREKIFGDRTWKKKTTVNDLLAKILWTYLSVAVARKKRKPVRSSFPRVYDKDTRGERTMHQPI